MGQITSTVSDTLNEWSNEVRREQARERAAIDAENAKLMKKQQQREEEAARRDYEEEIRRLGVMLGAEFASREEYTRLCEEAKKDLDERIKWSREFGPSLLEVLREKK